MKNKQRENNKKARQARSGNRGHVSESAHSLEAGSSFLTYKKARQARIGHRGHVSESARSLEAGSNFPVHKKKSRRVSLADSFLCTYL
ncbi:MAG: hypothetical protein FWF77_04980 [Defluviitaleaceae bacterium]|nr:hypothetical protein [Defluviitaleaceae bacterium]